MQRGRRENSTGINRQRGPSIRDTRVPKERDRSLSVYC